MKMADLDRLSNGPMCLLAEMAVENLTHAGHDETAVRDEIEQSGWQFSTHWSVHMTSAIADALNPEGSNR